MKKTNEDVVVLPITVVSPIRVILLGATLLMIGTYGFYYIPGMIADDANGSKVVNAFYCAAITLMTIGYGDICPGRNLTPFGKIFLVVFVLSGLGVFCGPFMDITSSWKNRIPGGLTILACIVLGTGVVIFSSMEGATYNDALYASIITGTTIGYGDLTPRSDAGKIAVALFGIVGINALAIILKPARDFFESICRVKSSTKID